MANLFNYLTKEIEKGNTLLDRKGNIVSVEKVTQALRKEYGKEFATDHIPEDMSFSEYAQTIMDSCYITLEFILGQLNPSEEYQTEPFEDDLPMTTYEEELPTANPESEE